MYNGKKITIEADSLYAAKLKAIEEFKVPKSKQGLLSVVSNKSMANQDFRFMADGGAINEDAKKRFDVDFYKSISDKKTSHEEIFRGDKFLDVVSQASKVAKSKGVNYVEFYYKNLFIGSLYKKDGYEFKEGRDSQKSPLSVNEEQLKTEGFADGGIMAKGGAMEHMIIEGDIVKAVYKNMLVIQSRYGVIDIVDLDSEPFARRIVVELITGENSVESAKAEIDRMIAYESNKMADGGSLEAQSLEMAQNVSVQIAHHAEELKDALNGKTYVEPWVTSMLQRAADNLSDATHYLEGKEEKMAKGGKLTNGKENYEKGDEGMYEGNEVRVVKLDTELVKYEYDVLDEDGNFKTHGLASKDKFERQFAYFPKMAKGGKIREFDDVLIISKNRLGMVEAIANNIYYVTTPFGETFEATMDDLQKIVSFKEGGDVKIGEIAMIAKENEATGDEVVKKISAGADVEMEHTEDRKVAMRIAVDHLKEDFNYYEKLRKAGL
jgi:hypothetical protein